jgi:hypothetical protein
MKNNRYNTLYSEDRHPTSGGKLARRFGRCRGISRARQEKETECAENAGLFIPSQLSFSFFVKRSLIVIPATS